MSFNKFLILEKHYLLQGLNCIRYEVMIKIQKIYFQFLALVLFTVVIICSGGVLGTAQQVVWKDNFYFIDGEKFFVKGIGYEIGAGPGELPWSRDFDPAQLRFDLTRIQDAGFNTIRTWAAFTQNELEVISEFDIKIIMGIWIDPHGDFADPVFRAQSLSTVSNVLAYSSNYDNIIGYIIMNEPLPETVFGAGYIETVSLWDEAKSIIHQAHPNRPVSIANTSNGTYIDPNLFDYAIYNAYIYNPVTVNFLHTYQTFVQSIRDSFTRDAPLILSEFGLSVSPTGPGNWRYGGNTLSEQSDGILHMYRSLINGGASGACVFAYSDGWWKGGNEFAHDDNAEEWFGLVEYQGLSDNEGTTRPAWNAVASYHSAVITEPRSGHVYSTHVPIEFFPSDTIAHMYVIDDQDTLLSLSNFTHHVSSNIDLQFTMPEDHEFQFHFYDQNQNLIKEETKIIMVAPTGIELPTVSVAVTNEDPWRDGFVDVTYTIRHQPEFEVESAIKHVFYPHVGFDYGLSFETAMPSGDVVTIERSYNIGGNVNALTIGASFDVRHGSFETRIVGELILSRADSVATSIKPVATEPNDPHIFPNPVGNILHIVNGTREYDKYAILDLQGRILHSGILPSSYQLDISWLPTGNYLLRCLSTRKGSSTLVKFVKG